MIIMSKPVRLMSKALHSSSSSSSMKEYQIDIHKHKKQIGR